MKVKICGMRDPANIAEIAALNPDYLGFIFYDRSPRLDCSTTMGTNVLWTGFNFLSFIVFTSETMLNAQCSMHNDG